MERLNKRSTSDRNSSWPLTLLVVLTGAFTFGCAMMKSPGQSSTVFNPEPDRVEASIGERADAATDEVIVSNPLAKEIRFDGKELLLGSGNCQVLPGSDLRKAIQSLLDNEKKRSAKAMINLHVRSAQQMLIAGIEKPAGVVESFVAEVLDHGKENAVWTEHIKNSKSRVEVAKQFAAAKQQLLSTSQTFEASEKSISQLQRSASKLNSLPLQLESQRLVALAKMASGQADEALNMLANAAEQATQAGMPNVASDLWMMACQGSMRSENVAQARKCWKAAVANQLTAIRSRPADQKLPAVDTVFWEQADKLKHPGDQFPGELKLALAPWYSRIGMTPDTETATQIALWAAIAEFQLTTGQPHLATLSIKRAEVNAADSTKAWLRIALARAMVSQGQESVAITILGSLKDDSRPAVRASSLATLGSIKIQAGAYEQGSRFLVDALNTPNAGYWPGQLAAKADLANVRLIVGRIDEALPVLHSVQNEMMTEGRWQSLCQSLENEIAILEHEGRKSDARTIRERIQMIENS